MSRILLVGAGRMGGALLHGWLAKGVPPADVTVVDPAFGELPVSVTALADLAMLPPDFTPDIVVLAVKPQIMDSVLPALSHMSGAVFLSIAAGRRIQSLAAGLGENKAIVRAMPNTPASIGRGVSVLVANHHADGAQRHLCALLLEAGGDVLWVQDEALMDAVTALSGSGPAYVFLLAEALTEAGAAIGLPHDLAVTLARATVTGAAELLSRSGEPPALLRENVTSC